MPRTFPALATLLLLAVPRVAAADLKVVASTPDLAALARSVGGEHVEVTALSLHTQDPHFVDARPHLALKLARADLLLVVGLDLEIGWLPTLQTGSRNGDIQIGSAGYLDCSRFVERLQVPTVKVERSMGDIHPGGNPHYMFDPRRAVEVANGIGARMAKLDPEHAADYRAGAERVAKSLEAKIGKWEQRLAKLRGQPVVSYHQSFVYLADWLGLEVVARIEPKPGIPPNPRHIAHVLTTARARGVKLILQESFYPRNATRAVAERSGARVVTVHAGPDLSRGQDYVAFVEGLVRKLEGAR
ncbi:MAG: zinc ABC transporter substrate-binding protein [Myxococcales bacterium]|jgi:zinc/manganese transport system substrate-binding protein